jgi:hypothetical protein
MVNETASDWGLSCFVAKIKGRGYIQVLRDNDDSINYKVESFKCVRDIDLASCWNESIENIRQFFDRSITNDMIFEKVIK